MRRISLTSGLVVLGFALTLHSPAGAQGGAPVTQAPSAAGAAAAARATLRDAQGKALGEATLRESSAGVLLKVDLTGVPAGPHAFHIHAVGRCDPPDFMSAGGHFNPAMMKHGLMAAGGPHAGDMPNVYVAADGKLSFEVLDTNVSLASGPKSLFDADGSAVVLHAMGDDYTTDPAGNAGGRMACGVIMR